MTDESPKPADANDDDLRILLPPELRKGWVVLPRYQVAQFYFVCLVLGAAVALGVVGWIYQIRWMYWSIPVGFTLLYALNFALRSKDKRYSREARTYSSAAKPDRPAT